MPEAKMEMVKEVKGSSQVSGYHPVIGAGMERIPTSTGSIAIPLIDSTDLTDYL